MTKQWQMSASRLHKPKILRWSEREAEGLKTQYTYLQQRFHQFQDQIDGYTWSAQVVGQQVIYCYYAPLVETLTGYPPFYFLTQVEAWLHLIHPDDRINLKNRLTGPRAGHRTVFEYRLRHADGQLRWVRETIIPSQDNQGQVVVLDGLVADVTEAKQIEVQLKRHTQELMLLNSILMTAFAAEDEAHLLELVCQKLASGCDLARVSTAEFTETKTELWVVAESRSEAAPSILHQQWTVQTWPVLAQLLSHQISVTLTETGRARQLGNQNYHPTPSTILFVPLIIQHQVVGALILEATANMPFTASQITFFWNVADQVAMIMEKNRLLAAAQQSYTHLQQIQTRLVQSEKMSALGQLAAGIAHDFNNILTSIMGFAEMSGRAASLPAPVKRHQAQIIAQSLRGAYLIRQILDFSHRSPSQKQPLDLAVVVQETVNLLRHTIPEHIQFSLSIAPGSYLIQADTTQLQQILTNLAVNAKDVMPEGGQLQFHLDHRATLPDELVSGGPQPASSWAALAVIDSGCGIPKTALPHIFEPFFTTKPVGYGTGLGLAQVYGLVHQHAGYIDVATEVGKGTTFTCYLPLLEATLPPQPAAPDQTAVPHGQGETVLVVEDEVTVRRVIGQILTELNYQVLTATNGQEALELYDHHPQPIRLVLTDLTMPAMGGVALAQALQQRNPHLKVIALSGYSLATIDKSAMPPSIIGWAQKPVGATQLAWLVYRSLQSQPPDPD